LSRHGGTAALAEAAMLDFQEPGKTGSNPEQPNSDVLLF
jgi:hypothetical protein